MEDHVRAQLDRIESKIDRLDERQDRAEIVLTKQHSSLEEHMRRSFANEKAVEVLSDKLQPVFNHVQVVSVLVKIGLGVGSAVAVGIEVLKLLK